MKRKNSFTWSQNHRKKLTDHINHIGVLGGGQLGRMLIQSAIDFNLEISILDPDQNAPCRSIAHKFVHGDFKDYQTVLEFGRSCQLVTIEIENVNTEALKQLVSEGVIVYPQPEVIELIQDKRVQKQFYQKQQLPTAEFRLVNDREEALTHADMLPAFFKLGKAGYDGRGVQRVTNGDELQNLMDGPGLLERLVDYQKEISVIVARNEQGQMATFPTVELVFNPHHHLVEFLFSPAKITREQETQAQKLACTVIEKLNMVGLLAVEMFLDNSGEILINEIAPRPHNSGHQTIEGNVTSQYEQLLRAILNWPLGNTNTRNSSAMVNLLGSPGHQGPAVYQGLKEVLQLEGTHVHLYGKEITKPFRKMGHVTISEPDHEKLIQKAQFVKDNLKVIT